MKRFRFLLIATSVVTCLIASDSLARPGGRGGRAAPARGARPSAGPSRQAGGVRGHSRLQQPPPARSNPHPGVSRGARPNRSQAPNLPHHPPGAGDVQRFLGGQSPSGTAPRRVPQTAYGWSNRAGQPFTPAWYADHPKAWQATHPHADVVAAAGAASLARWLAVPGVWAGESQTVIYSNVTETPPAESSLSEADQDDESQMGATATGESASSDTALDDQGEWMTIGVFALGPQGQTRATRVVQLLVDRGGAVRGSHYDLLTESVQDIHGTIDKKSLQIAWKIGPSGKVAFQAPLGELTQNEGRVTARFPDGQSALWQTKRMQE